MINMPPTPPKPQQNRPVVVIGGALQIKAEASARANMAKQEDNHQDKAKTWNSWNKKPESWKEGAWKSDKSWKAGQWNQWHDKKSQKDQEDPNQATDVPSAVKPKSSGPPLPQEDPIIQAAQAFTAHNPAAGQFTWMQPPAMSPPPIPFQPNAHPTTIQPQQKDEKYIKKAHEILAKDFTLRHCMPSENNPALYMTPDMTPASGVAAYETDKGLFCFACHKDVHLWDAETHANTEKHKQTLCGIHDATRKSTSKSSRRNTPAAFQKTRRSGTDTSQIRESHP